MTQDNMIIAVEAARKYNVELWRIFAAIDAGLLTAEIGIAGLTCIDEQQFIELLERHKPHYIQTAFAEFGGHEQRIEPMKKGRRKAHE